MTENAPTFKDLIALVAANRRLNRDQAHRAFDLMMSGEATPSQMGGFLLALRVRGESVEEITGAAQAMRARASRITAPAGAMDIVGTGGDKLGTYNVSTASALVVAGCGVPVAKHGNRAVSSQSGTADVLGQLGVNLEADFTLIERSIEEAGVGFMLAPRHHGAMRNVMPTRMELGTPTIFNILGPLCNPAFVRRYLMGCFRKDFVPAMAEALCALGAERAWVVHGHGGMDELSVTGPNFVAALEDGKIRTFDLDPADLGLKRARMEDLRGGDGAENARALRELLAGAPGAYRDIVILNAAAALLIAGKVADLPAGAELARHAIDDGKAAAALDKLIAISNAGGS